MNKVIIIFFMVLGPLVVAGQSLNWNGLAGNSDFLDAGNWFPSQVPTDTNLVSISSGMVELNGNVTVKRVLLSGSGNLTIKPGSELTIEGSADYGVRVSTSKELLIEGKLIVNNVGDAGILGIGRVKVEVDAEVMIKNAVTGIDIFPSDTLYNFGLIKTDSISSTRGVSIAGAMFNYGEGVVEAKTAMFTGQSIGKVHNYGIINNIDAKYTTFKSGKFYNYPGALYTNVGGGNRGLNVNKFYNMQGANVTITSAGAGSQGYGVFLNTNDTLINSGTISIGNTADDGFNNRGYVRNEVSGVINISNPGLAVSSVAFYNRDLGRLVNHGQIVATGGQIAAFQNNGAVDNEASGRISLSASSGNGLSNFGNFSNFNMLTISNNGFTGCLSTGSFFNGVGGTTSIGNSGSSGLEVGFNNGLVTNSGNFSITSSGSNGINNRGQVSTTTGSTLTVNSSGSNGIFSDGVITSSGNITVQGYSANGVDNDGGAIELTSGSLTRIR